MTFEGHKVTSMNTRLWINLLQIPQNMLDLVSCGMPLYMSKHRPWNCCYGECTTWLQKLSYQFAMWKLSSQTCEILLFCRYPSTVIMEYYRYHHIYCTVIGTVATAMAKRFGMQKKLQNMSIATSSMTISQYVVECLLRTVIKTNTYGKKQKNTLQRISWRLITKKIKK